MDIKKAGPHISVLCVIKREHGTTPLAPAAARDDIRSTAFETLSHLIRVFQ
jgi:hypothetical protein